MVGHYHINLGNNKFGQYYKLVIDVSLTIVVVLVFHPNLGMVMIILPWHPDLHQIITQLQLKDVILVGFSMGGGEVVRYCTNYGTENISKVALISSIIPLVPQKDDNPHGVPQNKLDSILHALETDRVGFLKDFHKNFYNYVDAQENKVSKAQLDYDWTIAANASPRAT